MNNVEILDEKERKRIYMREYARKRRLNDLTFLQKQREAGKKSQAKRRQNGKDTTKEWRSNNKEKIAEYNKSYAAANKEKINLKRNEYSFLNRKKLNNTQSNWREKNREQIKEYNKNYTNVRYLHDPVFKLKLNQRTRIRAVLKTAKTRSTNELLGCSYEELKIYIESKFLDGMNWGNMGKWHIDHIVPLAAFDLTVETNQKIAFNFKNLQPLWAIDNLKKGAKYA